MGPEFRVKVELKAAVSRSEDSEKVVQAMRNVVGGTGEVFIDGDDAKLFSEDLSSLSQVHDQLRDRHVRAAARRLLLQAMKKDSSVLMLNRQAAAAGVLALCGSAEQSPLGPIYLTIRCRRIEALVDWLTAYEEE